jgi:prepilin-type processing-associated H-X9-DG protein
MINGWFVWGLVATNVASPSDTVYYAERRSEAFNGTDPYCDDIWHSWWNPTNPVAPENDMDPDIGAFAAKRHSGRSNFVFADTHAGSKPFSQIWGPNLDKSRPF